MFGLVQDEQTSEDYTESVEDIKFIVHEDLLDQFGTFKIDFISNFLERVLWSPQEIIRVLVRHA